jgi:hypothetical protein
MSMSKELDLRVFSPGKNDLVTLEREGEPISYCME